VLEELSREALSTPSLGITGVLGVRRGPLLRMRAFNSLSRDHTLGEVGERIATLIKLSTPSLGITEPDSGIFRLSAAFCRGTSSHK
jgi:hypothetical protein